MDHDSLLFRLFLEPLAHTIVCTIAAYLVAPTQFIKVIYQETGKAYGTIIKEHLHASAFKKVFAGAHLYALRQSISALAFGLGQWLFLVSLTYYQINSSILLVVWQCFLIGLTETVMTIYSETKEIAANKGELMQRPAAAIDIITPIFLRNYIAISAPILAYEITKEMDTPFINALVSALFGIVVSMISMPFDLIATQNCGSAKRMTWISRLKQNIIAERNVRSIFNGLTMRILQIVAYSVAHSAAMLFLKTH